jgi:hypothetical protein
MDAVETTIEVDVIDVDVLLNLGDELAECIRKLAGIIALQ